MNKSKKRIGIILVTSAAIIVTIILLARRAPEQFSFRPAPTSLTLRTLGPATNSLQPDQTHTWQAFCVSNGTSKNLFYTVTAVEYQTSHGWTAAGNWLSNTIRDTSLMARRTSSEIAPGKSDILYATLPRTNIAWRLRIGFFESTWADSVSWKWRATFQSGPTPVSWSGPRYELISDPVNP